MSARFKGWRTTPARRNKHNARKTVHPEHGEFDSKGEMERFCDLVAMEKAGIISELSRQPHFDFIVNGTKIGRGYTADYRYVENGETVIEDFKGNTKRMPLDWPLRRDLMLACHGIRVRIYTKR